MSNARKSLIQQAFNKMDADKSGFITVCSVLYENNVYEYNVLYLFNHISIFLHC